MLEQNLWNYTVRELAQYGRDEQGNYVLSPESMQDLIRKVVKAADMALDRPVITTTYRDVVGLCVESGLKVQRVIEDNVMVEKIYDKTGQVEIYEEAQNLVNSTTLMVLRRVRELTQIKKE